MKHKIIFLLLFIFLIPFVFSNSFDLNNSFINSNCNYLQISILDKNLSNFILDENNLFIFNQIVLERNLLLRECNSSFPIYVDCNQEINDYFSLSRSE